MSPDHIYILDANVFIESAKRYYALDIAPGFWDALLNNAQSGRIMSIDKVKIELDINSDPISIWANDSFSHWFESTDQSDVIAANTDIIRWAYNQNYTIDAKEELASNIADSWLVAYSYAKDCIVVTDEVYEPARLNKIKIPNICKEFDVRCINTFQMVRDLNIIWR